MVAGAWVMDLSKIDMDLRGIITCNKFYNVTLKMFMQFECVDVVRSFVLLPLSNLYY